ncbi:hypothetical protein B9Z55_016126 [Caenorhabditis nigoni]|uniref:SXP/RAL-2 family protein Ani s 5-like cation-binding domain-containing protein n=1 Tax=Caenorhabditis nigoni TaxID=1611254 RepID=A0A2G5UDU9_9PELO|nr:hypothetical protein B9Z55_016126 [Caenorhabditis nigoni]
MLFYKALLVVLVSTAVVSALPALGNPNELLNGLTGQLHGAVPIGNLGELIQQLLGQLKDIKAKLPIDDIHNVIKDVKDTASGAASGVVDGASAVIPEPLSGVVNEVEGAASGAVDNAANMIQNAASDAAGNVVDAASDAANN